ncbi:MAG: DMT family transporter [Bacteroidales bacterium]
MILLLLCILFSAAVLVTFKIAEHLKVNPFSAILVNYATACILGLLVARGNIKPLFSLNLGNIVFMLMLGALCIIVFRFLALSIKRAGVAVTTVASKMSVIIPIFFSIYIDANDSLNGVKITGIVLALIAVLLTVYKKENTTASKGFYLPLIIFIGIGLVDSSMKYAQITFVTDDMNSIFNSSIFAVSGIVGFALLPFNKPAVLDLKRQKTWIIGIVLGLVNFSSMYFMIAALNYVNPITGVSLQGSILFGINNISVVLINVFIGLMLFKEHPTRTNWIGISLSIVAIAILAYGH